MSPRFERQSAVRVCQALFGAFFLSAALFLGGCRPPADLDTPIVLVGDTPQSYPATPAIFRTTTLPPPPSPQQIKRAFLPPSPPAPAQVAQFALAAANAPPSAPSDAGLIVYDPTYSAASLSQFSVGCGRWLDLYAAGQPELGQTPLWDARTRVMQETKRTALDMTPTQAQAAAAITGTTHAACGTLTGTATSCTLTYTLYDLRHPGQTVGVPWVQSGTEAQVLAALPIIARVLDARLGVSHPQVPASVGLNLAEFMQIVAIVQESAPSDSDLATLFGLTTRSPFAAMFFLNTLAANDQVLLERTVQTLFTQAPNNSLVISKIGYSDPATLRPYAKQIQLLSQKYPGCALLAHTQVWEQREWGTHAGEFAAARQATQDAPRDPMTWLSLGATLGNIGQDLRQCRVAGDISTAEWTALGRLYVQQVSADQTATKLDPRWGHAWSELAEAATFAGDTPVADAAMQKALTLDLDKEDAYDWALQMYQPKWNNEPSALVNVAALAVAYPWSDAGDAIAVSDNLTSAGLAPQAAQVLAGVVARQRALTAKSPSDVIAHWNLAQALAAQSNGANLREATLQYRIAEHLMPRSADIHANLAGVLDQRDRTKDAIAEWRQAVALDPFNAEYRTSLGHDLKHAQLFAEALVHLSIAQKLDPRNADTYATVGDLLSMQHRYAAAVPEYRAALRLDYFNSEALTGLPGTLDSAGQYQASLQAAQQTVRVIAETPQAGGEVEAPLHDVMADDYLHQKAWDKSLAQSRLALSCDSTDACAHENLAEAYIAKGNKTQAQTEWHNAILLNDPVITPIAEKFLAAHHMQ